MRLTKRAVRGTVTVIGSDGEEYPGKAIQREGGRCEPSRFQVRSRPGASRLKRVGRDGAARRYTRESADEDVRIQVVPRNIPP